MAKRFDWDPYVRGPIQVLKKLADANPSIEPEGLKQAWDKMEEHMEDPKGKPWARVRGPESATYFPLKEINWKESFDKQQMLEGLIDNEGSLWRFNHVISWHDFEEEEVK